MSQDSVAWLAVSQPVSAFSSMHPGLTVLKPQFPNTAADAKPSPKTETALVRHASNLLCKRTSLGASSNEGDFVPMLTTRISGVVYKCRFNDPRRLQHALAAFSSFGSITAGPCREALRDRAGKSQKIRELTLPT